MSRKKIEPFWIPFKTGWEIVSDGFQVPTEWGTLALHRARNGQAGWVVSDPTSGGQIACAGRPSDAIAQAIAKITEKGGASALERARFKSRGRFERMAGPRHALVYA